jgi:NADH dehydrogenase [ubiquinone] 1 alpha subcomplex assembly factor 7
MSALEALIRAEIETGGAMPLERYMTLCLGHPEHGYYMAKPAIGASGDFTTAPEVSQMFGEILGAVLAHAWQALAGRR